MIIGFCHTKGEWPAVFLLLPWWVLEKLNASVQATGALVPL
jgi:hypothetical protein